MAQRELWTIERMRTLINRPFCPKCHLFIEEHDDNECDMRYTEEEETCVLSVSRL